MSRRAIAVRLGLLALLVAGCSVGDDPVSTPARHVVTPAANTAKAPQSASPAPQKAPPSTPKPPSKPDTKPTVRPVSHDKSGPYGSMHKTGVKAVALTFDDGPHPTWTPKVLDLLHKQGIKATFCLIGVEVRTHPELVRRIVREGHTLCNHSWSHNIQMGKKSPAQIRADLERTNREIRKAVPGAKIPFYRQPGGEWTTSIARAAKDLGMTPLHWSVDPRDWTRPGAAKISQRVKSRCRPGSIVLMHDGGGNRSGTVAAAPGIIADLKRRYGIVQLK